MYIINVYSNLNVYKSSCSSPLQFAASYAMHFTDIPTTRGKI